jgi:hypothetical protein
MSKGSERILNEYINCISFRIFWLDNLILEKGSILINPFTYLYRYTMLPALIKHLSTYLKPLLLLFLLLYGQPLCAVQINQDYGYYHQRILQAEEAIGQEDFEGALEHYRQAFDSFAFSFLRDYQVACQLALHLGKTDQAFGYLRKGVLAGWDMKSIRKNKFLAPLRRLPEWHAFAKEYPALRKSYQARLHEPLRKEVKRMFATDQRKALGALFTYSAAGQDRYAEKKFAPHSRKQIIRLLAIIDRDGYPGERLIGNSYWMATIVSHHNSISQAHARQDSLYAHLKPLLLDAIRKGQLSPYEFALMDNWFITVESGHQQPSYGFLGALTTTDLPQANRLRSALGLRSVETRSRLVEIQEQTGMNFYLPGNPWVKGKIAVAEQ